MQCGAILTQPYIKNATEESKATATAPKLATALMPAALGLLVGLGALDPDEPLPLEPDEVAAAEPGVATPTKEPVRGPGAAVAAAPEPLRAPVGRPGTVLDALKSASKALAAF